VYGTGQGSGNSPHVWTMFSSVLLQMLHKEAQGAQYWTHDNIIYKMVSTAYVDDVNTHYTTENVNPGGLISSMSEDFFRWTEIVEASGGKLAPEKCSYYSMGGKFSIGGKPEMIDVNLREQADIHHNFIACRILLSEYHKSLGNRMSPKDPNKSQINHMRDIQDRFVGILNQSNLTLNEHEV
jgi:hypothetical protein